MKMFIEIMQAQAQVLAEPQKQFFKVWTLETYCGKAHIEYYHFCHHCEDYFKISDATKINHTLFATSFLHNTISLR